MLRVALPNKGTLAKGALDLVRDAGYYIERSEGQLLVCDPLHGVEFVFIRPRDIALYAAKGVFDLGVTGSDMVAESGLFAEEQLALGFGRSSFYYAVPQGSALEPDGFAGLRVATSFARIVRDDLVQRGVEAEIVVLDGAVEIALRLGIADVVADVVQTGRTLMQAGLQTVGPPLLESQAVLVGSGLGVAAQLLVERLRGVVLARSYVLVEYDVSSEQVERACALTPGIEAPTIAPLQRPGWVAVRSMIARTEAHLAMDRLGELGAKGIVLTDILTCRL